MEQEEFDRIREHVRATFPDRDDEAESKSYTPDLTGMDEAGQVMISVFQVYQAARLSGFGDTQAFMLARDFFGNIMAAGVAQAAE